MSGAAPVVDRTGGLPTAAPVRRGLSRKHREWIAAYLFVAPDLLGLLVFLATPMVLALSMGFFKVSGFGDYHYVGLANYRRLLSDSDFHHSIRVTAIYALVLVPGLYAVSLALALLMQQRLPFTGVLRSMFYLPNVVSLVVIGVVWKFLLITRIGIVARLSDRLGFTERSWLGDPAFTLWTVLGITIWFLMGFYMIVFLAGLQDIPSEYYEAARIDGAGYWEMFRSITLPLLKPTSFFVLLVSSVAAVAGGQGVDLIIVMTSGGPARATSLVTYYVYQQAFQVGDYGYAAALASFLVLVLLIATIGLFALTKGGRFELG